MEANGGWFLRTDSNGGRCPLNIGTRVLLAAGFRPCALLVQTEGSKDYKERNLVHSQKKPQPTDGEQEKKKSRSLRMTAENRFLDGSHCAMWCRALENGICSQKSNATTASRRVIWWGVPSPGLVLLLMKGRKLIGGGFIQGKNSQTILTMRFCSGIGVLLKDAGGTLRGLSGLKSAVGESTSDALPSGELVERTDQDTLSDPSDLSVDLAQGLDTPTGDDAVSITSAEELPADFSGLQ
jgi:hypothetical protein